MSVYGLRIEELLEPLEQFLREREGEVSAEILAKTWNLKENMGNIITFAGLIVFVTFWCYLIFGER